MNKTGVSFKLTIKTSLAALALICSFFQAVHAEEITMSASVDRNVIGLNEQLIFTLSISGKSLNIPNIDLPQIQNFNVVSSGRSSNTSIINGQMSSQVNFNFTLVPQSTGKFTIPALQVQFDGKTYRTGPIQVEVTQGSPQGSGLPQNQGKAGASSLKNIFVTASVDKSDPFVNEQVVYTFKVFQRVRLLSQPSYAPPNLSGFWSEEGKSSNYQTTINGVQYLVNEVKTFLFPTKSGPITIGKAVLQARIEDSGSSDPFNDDFFRSFFGGGKTVTLETEPITLKVKPLPMEGRPSALADTVGQFSISAKIDKQALKTNEPLTLSVTISGTGNLKTIEEPKLQESSGFRKFENVSSVNLDKNAASVKGSKTFNFVLVPVTAGKKQIPPVSFSYFDPGKQTYKTISTDSFYVDVAQGSGETAQNYTPPQAKPQDIKILNTDIRYIKTSLKYRKAPGALWKNKFFLVLNLIPFLLAGWSFFYSKFSNRLKNDSGFARKLIASKEARKYLKNAKSLLKPGSVKEYYLAISKALIELIAHKFNVSSDGLTFSDISALLAKKNIIETELKDLKEILDECDLARFSAVKMDIAAMQAMYMKASATLSLLEKKLR